jgi:hypothetical protein
VQQFVYKQLYIKHITREHALPQGGLRRKIYENVKIFFLKNKYGHQPKELQA